jgi:hypothetical protein
MEDTKPSTDGELIDFKITAEMLKKYEKATALSKGIKKEKAIKAEPGVAGEELDEFDALVGSGSADISGGAVKVEKVKKPRAKKEPGEAKPKKTDGLKQSKLDFKKKPVRFCGNCQRRSSLIWFLFYRRRRMTATKKATLRWSMEATMSSTLWSPRNLQLHVKSQGAVLHQR